MNRPRVLLADDHRLVAEGLKNILAAEFDLVGIVEDGRALLGAVATLRPDVIVSDIAMPLLNGIEALEELKKMDPGVRLVFLTMHRDVAYARRAMEAGARGYVLKHSAPEELIMAVRAALEDRTYVSPLLAGELLDSMRRDPRQGSDMSAILTLRQREILRFLAEGLTAKQIAQKLGISQRTVEFHKYRMMESIGASSGSDLIHFAIRHGIVDA